MRHRPLAAAECFGEWWCLPQNPLVDSRGINGDAAFLDELFLSAVAQGMRHVPLDAREDDVLREVSTFEADRRLSPRLVMDNGRDHIRAAVQQKIREGTKTAPTEVVGCIWTTDQQVKMENLDQRAKERNWCSLCGENALAFSISSRT